MLVSKTWNIIVEANRDRCYWGERWGIWGYWDYDNPAEELDQFLLSLCVSASSRLYKKRPLNVWRYVEATGGKAGVAPSVWVLPPAHISLTHLLHTSQTINIVSTSPVSSDIPLSFPLFFRNDKLTFLCVGSMAPPRLCLGCLLHFDKVFCLGASRRTSGVHFSGVQLLCMQFCPSDLFHTLKSVLVLDVCIWWIKVCFSRVCLQTTKA